MKGVVICAAFAASATFAAEWEDPSVNGVNRLEAHTWMAPLASVGAALDDRLEPETPYVKSLNGTWRIFWTGSPENAPQGFECVGFDDSGWFDIDVPSCVELKGWGVPIYTNAKLPFANDPPRINHAYNPVSSYRTAFTVPVEWKGRRIVLRFEGVASAMKVWVNGREVGYSEDSRLPAEFDVTEYLNRIIEQSEQSNNTLAVRVYRWCDGSYLENQDMFRLSGIYRDVVLYAEPREDAIRDATVRADAKGRLTVDCPGASWTLYDAQGRAVDVPVKGVRRWSAEDPYLYTLVLRKGTDIRRLRVGFRTFEIRGNELFLNGAKLRFRGVNRHETHPVRGYSVTREDMLNDVLLMKRNNIDSVRTSHYPCHRHWYDLCDRYGLYVMAEANVESGFNNPAVTNTVAFFPAWTQPICERNERNALNFRNHPSVLVWSLGNESGGGPDFVPAAEKIRKLDLSRPIHYVDLPTVSDFDCGMYKDIRYLESLRGTLTRPYVFTEYAHAMGNGLGNFREYWDLIYTDPGFCGGFVWDWADQVVEKGVGRDRHLAYGGDFDEEVNDGPFCVNGIVTGNREETAKSREVRHCHRQLVVIGVWPDLELENRYAFTSADAFVGSWLILAEGVSVARGTFDVPAVRPGEKARLKLDLPEVRGNGECFLNIEFAFRTDAPWAKAGYVVSRNQTLLRRGERAPSEILSGKGSSPVRVNESAASVVVEAGATSAVFSRETGTLAELTMGGRLVLRDDSGRVSGPRLTVMRALTDNDIWLRNVYWSSENREFLYENGVTQLRYHARPYEVTRLEDGTVRIASRIRVTSAKTGGFEHKMTWTVRGDGSLLLANEVEPFGHLPPLPRLGLSWTLDPELETLTWYGRGPGENYIDRNSATFVGRYCSTVTDQYVDYVRPQDCGAKTDVRWVALADSSGRGVRFSAPEPFVAQALHYTWEDLEFARHRRGQQRICAKSVPRPEVCLNTDFRQLGLGGASCGTEPLPNYKFPNVPEKWTLEIEPYGQGQEPAQ